MAIALFNFTGHEVYRVKNCTEIINRHQDLEEAIN